MKPRDNVIKACIFDVDGTLVDSVQIHAETWQAAFREFGHEIPAKEIRRQIGKGGDQLMAAFLSDREVKEFGDRLQARRAGILRDERLSDIHAFPGVRQLFERIRSKGIRIALASSAKGKELAAYKQKADIVDLVEEEASSDDVERSKPHGDIFQAALDSLGGLASRDVIAVGDTPYDAEAAGKVGLRTVGLLSGGFAERDLRGAGCVAVYRDPAELLDNLENVIRGQDGASS